MRRMVTLIAGILSLGCAPETPPVQQLEMETSEEKVVVVLAESNQEKYPFNVAIPSSGRYRVSIYATVIDSTEVWIEDYITNPDDRVYNITGQKWMSPGQQKVAVEGSPLNKGMHPMQIHVSQPNTQIDSVVMELIQPALVNAKVLQQSTAGKEWKLVWSDEFEGDGLPDTTLWNYNIGDWGWGNNELQYYTAFDLKNARQEKGCLIIEAHKESADKWSSARLTTQGKFAFTYGRIEMRAKVPTNRGTWAAGWMLGDEYVDELSWPYCGEIDILECVGFEIDDVSGQGLNHATCHTRAYYFKQGNQIGAEINVDSMNTQFHIYAIEWDEESIRGYLDGEHYYTYDKNSNDLEWPFNKPQNIVLNLAIGGGWGGAKGVDSTFTQAQYILDYVRVYGR